MKKQKGGAEKEREKKRKALVSAAATSANISKFFSSEAQTGAAGSESDSQSVAGITTSDTNTRPGAVSATKTGAEIMVSDTQFGAQITDTVINTQTQVGITVNDTQSVVENTAASEEREQSLDERSVATVDYFAVPKTASDTKRFFAYHPVQPRKISKTKANVFVRQNGTVRSWLTYSEREEALFCTVCLAYSKDTEHSSFINGMKDWRHVHQRIEEHEKCRYHNDCAETHFITVNEKDVGAQLFAKERSLHKEKIQNNREVMQRVVDIVKVIGKRGLSYRGSSSESESAYGLDNPILDHGTFLELVLLLSKYDILLKDHLEKVIKQSKKAHDAGSKGRGSSLTLISKTTVNLVIMAISSLIKSVIVDEVRQAGMFSVQLDTTQDVSVKDQCSIILRYVFENQIYERLIAVVNTSDSTGKGMCELLKKTLEENNIGIGNCVSNSTDGASNMQGIYNGFTAWLTKEAPGQIHTWCYAHILNLVIHDATQNILASSSLFSLMNQVAVFFRESYKRMDIWENISKNPRKKRLQMIGETRWWAKHAAISKVFGCFTNANPDNNLYVDVVLALLSIEENEQAQPDIRAKARSLNDSLLKYETVMTAFTYLRIFELTTPLSKYLQTSGMDVLKAHQFVMSTITEVQNIQRDVEGVHRAVSEFIDWTSKKLEERCEADGIETVLTPQDSFPEKRVRRKKRMPGENGKDEPIADAMEDFTVIVHNKITDQVVQSLKSRFESNGSIYRDMACLSPLNFSDIATCLPQDALETLSSLLLRFEPSATKENLQLELINLAKNWSSLRKGLPEEYAAATARQYDDEDEGEQVVSTVCKRCKNCAVCVYQTLQAYNLLTDAYGLIGLAYKLMLTLSTTQVACERSFSTLKFVKNRLRSTLTEKHLDALMLMCVEKDVLSQLDCQDVIDKVAENSDLLKKNLTF